MQMVITPHTLMALELNTFQNKTENVIGNKDIKYITNIDKMKAYDSVMCGYFCIAFIDCMFKSKRLTAFTNLLPQSNFKDNDRVISNYYLKKIKLLKHLSMKLNK